MKKYIINGQEIITNNLKKEYPHFFKSFTYVWEMATGKTYLFVNDYEYRKPHYFTEEENAFIESRYGKESWKVLGAQEKVVPLSNLENGIYTIGSDRKAVKVA